MVLQTGAYDGHVRLRQCLGKRLHTTCVEERHMTQTPEVMVWAAIIYDTRTLVILNDAQLCDQDILQPHALLLIAGLPTTIFQHDNAQPQTHCKGLVRLPCVTLPHFLGLNDLKIYR